MANTPAFKVYTPSGFYVAACKHAEDAACLAALHGDDTTVRYNHRLIVWKEGIDGQAANSYDAAAIVMHDRIDAAYPPKG